MAAAELWLGLDIGGTRLKGGLLDGRGRPWRSHAEPTLPGQPRRGLERQLDALAGRLLRDARGRLAGIGASITGPVDPERGCVYLPGKIRGLDRHATVPYLRRRWGVPVVADNDGRMACFGEWEAGAGRGLNNLVVITLGTGIGSGVVLDGRLLNNAGLQLGTQIGHMIIAAGGPRCLTGPRGTGESLASVTALLGAVRDHLARGLPSTLSGEDPARLGFPDVVRAVRRRDRVIGEVFADWLDRFAAVLLNAYYAYAPERIVLAGGPARSGEFLARPLRERVNAQAFRYPKNAPIEVVASPLAGDAGWRGAALMARDKFREDLG